MKTAAARIDEMRRAVGVPVAFETSVNYLRPHQDELSDGCFVRSVAEAADCGILLDLHNLLSNERNGRDSLRAVFDEIPPERVWEIHLAGGMQYRGYWLDSHSSHIEGELFDVARAIVAECPNIRAIIFQMMEQHIDERSRDALRVVTFECDPAALLTALVEPGALAPERFHVDVLTNGIKIR